MDRKSLFNLCRSYGFPEKDSKLQFIWKCNKGNCVSPYDAWHDDYLLSKAIDNLYSRIESDDTRVVSRFNRSDDVEKLWMVLSRFTIAKIAPCVTEFSPDEMVNILLSKEVDSVYDPFSGLGGRAEGSRRLGIEYEGYDINQGCIDYSETLYPDTKGVYHIRNLFNQVIETDKTVVTSPPWDDAEIWYQTDGYELPIKPIEWWINEVVKHVHAPKYIFHINKKIDSNDIEVPVGLFSHNEVLVDTTESNEYFGYMKNLFIIDNVYSEDSDAGAIWEIYRITTPPTDNNPDGYTYIGQHKKYNDNKSIGISYFGSGKLLWDRIYPKYGYPWNTSGYSFEILEEVYSQKDADEKEISYISEYHNDDIKSGKRKNLNLAPGGNILRRSGDHQWYNNGEYEILINTSIGEIPPHGYTRGRIDPFKVKGCYWYNNGKQEIKCYPGCAPTGYTLGRLENSNDMLGRKSYTNGTVDIYCKPGTEPKGFYLGRSYNPDRGWYNRDKIAYHNSNGDWDFFIPNEQPDGWIMGYPRGTGSCGKHWYTDGNGVYKLFLKEDVPDGWYAEYNCPSPTEGTKCYNDGIRNYFYIPGTQPSNLVEGMIKSDYKRYNEGMIWYTDGKGNEGQFFEGKEPEGWHKGRSTSGTVIMNDGVHWERVPECMANEYEKKGWVYGTGGYKAVNKITKEVKLFKYSSKLPNTGLPDDNWEWMD